MKSGLKAGNTASHPALLFATVPEIAQAHAFNFLEKQAQPNQSGPICSAGVLPASSGTVPAPGAVFASLRFKVWRRDAADTRSRDGCATFKCVSPGKSPYEQEPALCRAAAHYKDDAGEAGQHPERGTRGFGHRAGVIGGKGGFGLRIAPAGCAGQAAAQRFG